MIDALPLLLGPEGYQISRSVRLRSSASAYFNRTPSSATNRTTWTWSGWAKRSNLGAWGALFSSGVLGGTSSFEYIAFRNDDSLQWVTYTTSTQANLITTQVFRDPSAWYHIVVAFDSTQATSSNRVKIYVNGVQVTSFSTSTYPSLNYSSFINNNQIHTIGRDNGGDYFDGYLTEVNFIDGQALTPASFGETNYVTGVWQPKKYTGTYGTNGFYLTFSDNSAATAAAIGKDSSGNGNNWTPNNISVTAGVTYDSMLDVPTQWADGGNGRGNYCVLNPLNGLAGTLSNANLRHTTTVANWQSRTGTLAVSSGKWYWEGTVGSVGANGMTLGGIAASSRFWNGGGNYPGGNVDTYGYYSANGNKQTNGTSVAYGASYTNNDVIGTALDLDAGTLTFYKNGVSQGVAFTGLTGEFVPAMGVYDNTYFADMNFGQRPFAYTPPSGFKALNTLNLPTPTILKGNQYFNAVLYTGNGTGQTVSGVGFQPDFVWGKSRSQIRNHNLYDAVRGAGNMLLTNGTNAELTGGELSAFTSDGFTLGSNVYQMNPSGDSMVAWNWKRGATQGFDIVTYTGNGTAGRTISHSLGVAPAMMIMKSRSNARTWPVYHKNLTSAAYYIGLETTNQQLVDNTMFNSTAPTSSVFTVGTYQNANAETYVAYLFAEVAGFSKFGSYTGNGSADGPFVFCGFRPRFVMVKRTDTTGDWIMEDSGRNAYNLTNLFLLANSSTTEGVGNSTNVVFDFLSNGFKLLGTAANGNASGGTYIFAVFCENPFKNALAR